MTNESKNTGAITNQPRSSASRTWNESDFPWDEAPGTWDNPYNFENAPKNTGAISNEPKA